MNHWGIGQVPYSWNPLSKTMDWSGSDTLENFNKNKDKDTWDNIKISYEYNSHGFRTHEPTSLLGQKVNIALGCSITEGIGLPVDRVWPSLLEQKLDHPVLNFGIGGASTDTVARILTNISTQYDIQTVFILWPFVHRIEMYPGDYKKPTEIRTILPQNSKIEHQWALSNEMSIQRFNHNQLIVNLLSKNYKFNTNQQLATILLDQIVHKTRARDGQHPGIDMQVLLADMMLSNYAAQ